MVNASRPLHRILVVLACLMFAEALAVPISAAISGSHARGLSGWKTMPIAQAPCDAASSASATLVTPQIFTFTLIPLTQ